MTTAHWSLSMASSSSIAKQIIEGSRINNPRNDVTWVSGWTGEQGTYQYRFGADEARKAVAFMKGNYTRRQQKTVLVALKKEATNSRASDGKLGLTSPAAAVLNAYAKAIGAPATFYGTRAPPAPIG